MEDQGPQIVAVALSFLVIAWVVVLLRCYVRIRVLKNCFGIDDALSVACLVCIQLEIIIPPSFTVLYKGILY